ncbi:glycosyltransferase family 2 protein [bacterium]|nr:MAG: glycosyltransferase family 2 protein [bacterium]
MRVGFVFTNFNDAQITGEAVRSIVRDKSRHELKIVIVDNGSNQENLALLEKIAEENSIVSLICNPTNIGYFRGLNLGISYLRRCDQPYEHMVIGNNDLVFPTDFIEMLNRNEDQLDRFAVIAPDIVTMDGEHQNPHVIKDVGKFRESIYDLYYSNYFVASLIRRISDATRKITKRKDEEQFRVAQTITQGYGACYIVGPLFFKYFETLWAPTFFYHEELFLSKQLESKGLKTLYEPSIAVSHHTKTTMSRFPSRKKWELGREAHKEYRKYRKSPFKIVRLFK